MTLLSEVETFLAATGIAESTFGKCAIGDGHLVKGLRRGRQLGDAMTAKVRDFMAANRDVTIDRRVPAADLPGPATVDVALVPDPPARAPVRRITPEYAARLRAGATPAEQIATLCVASVPELIETVKRRWPGQWQRIVDAARTAGTLPGAMLGEVIERGLERGA